MRLTNEQAEKIRQLAHKIAGEKAHVLLFGSRLDDALKGGDVDLLLALPEPVENPALMAARLASQVSRALDGRRTDVLISAPNLQQLPIHRIALTEGRLL